MVNFQQLGIPGNFDLGWEEEELQLALGELLVWYMSIASLLHCSNKDVPLVLYAQSSLPVKEEARQPYESISASLCMVRWKCCGRGKLLMVLHNYFGRAQLLMPDMSGVKTSASDADALVPGALEKYTISSYPPPPHNLHN